MDETSLLHAQLPCPVCSKPVHVLANADTRRTRWACTECLSIGEAPLPPLMQQPLPAAFLRPIASA